MKKWVKWFIFSLILVSLIVAAVLLIFVFDTFGLLGDKTSPVITTGVQLSVGTTTTLVTRLEATDTSLPITWSIPSSEVHANKFQILNGNELHRVTTLPGVYDIGVTATDAAGNRSPVYTLQVTVQDTSAPSITTSASHAIDNDNLLVTTLSGTDMSLPLSWSIQPEDTNFTITEGDKLYSTTTTPGTYTVNVIAEDSKGNVSDPFTLTVFINDVLGPTLIIESTDVTVSNLGDSNVTTLSATTKSPPLVWTLVDGENNFSLVVAGGAESATIYRVTTIPGVYSIGVYATDNNANRSNTTNINITVEDDVSPIINMDTNFTVTQTMPIPLSATDDDSNIVWSIVSTQHTDFYIDGHTLDPRNVNPGEHAVTVRVTDTADNYSDVVLIVRVVNATVFSVNDNAIAVGSLSTDNQVWNFVDSNYDFSIVDNKHLVRNTNTPIGVYTFQVTPDEGITKYTIEITVVDVTAPVINMDSNFTVTQTMPIQLSAADYDLNIVWSITATEDINFYIDGYTLDPRNVIPGTYQVTVLATDTAENSSQKTLNVTVNNATVFTVNDNETTVGSLSTDNQVWNFVDSNYDFSIVDNKHLVRNTTTPIGNYTFQVTPDDRDTQYTIEITVVDVTAPVINMDSNFTVMQTMPIPLSATDDDTNIVWSINTQDTDFYIDGHTLDPRNVNPGTYQVTVLATDTAENSSQKTLNVTVNNATVFTVDDNAIAVGSLSTDNQVWNFVDSNYDFSIVDNKHLVRNTTTPIGNYTFQVTPDDGNTKYTIEITVVDVTAPVINMDSNFTVMQTMPIPLSATDDDTNIVWSINTQDTDFYIDGHTLDPRNVNPGTYQVTVLATDSAENSSEKTLNVTVTNGTEFVVMDFTTAVGTLSTDNRTWEIVNSETNDTNFSIQNNGDLVRNAGTVAGIYSLEVTPANDTTIYTIQITVKEIEIVEVGATSPPNQYKEGMTLKIYETPVTDTNGPLDWENATVWWYNDTNIYDTNKEWTIPYSIAPTADESQDVTCSLTITDQQAQTYTNVTKIITVHYTDQPMTFTDSNNETVILGDGMVPIVRDDGDTNFVEGVKYKIDTNDISDADGINQYTYKWYKLHSNNLAEQISNTDTYTPDNTFSVGPTGNPTNNKLQCQFTVTDKRGKQYTFTSKSVVIQHEDQPIEYDLGPNFLIVKVGDTNEPDQYDEGMTLEILETSVTDGDTLDWSSASVQWYNADYDTNIYDTNKQWTIPYSIVQTVGGSQNVTCSLTITDEQGQTYENLTKTIVVHYKDQPMTFTDSNNATDILGDGMVPVVRVDDDTNFVENVEYTIDTSGISDADDINQYTYQWYKDSNAIENASSSNYTPDYTFSGPNNSTLSCQFTVTDGRGKEYSFKSASVEIQHQNRDPSDDSLTIIEAGGGTPDQYLFNMTLEVDTNSVTDPDILNWGTAKYEWKFTDSSIATKSTQTMVLTNEELTGLTTSEDQISVTVTVHVDDVQGSTNTFEKAITMYNHVPELDMGTTHFTCKPYIIADANQSLQYLGSSSTLWQSFQYPQYDMKALVHQFPITSTISVDTWSINITNVDPLITSSQTYGTSSASTSGVFKIETDGTLLSLYLDKDNSSIVGPFRYTMDITVGHNGGGTKTYTGIVVDILLHYQPKISAWKKAYDAAQIYTETGYFAYGYLTVNGVTQSSTKKPTLHAYFANIPNMAGRTTRIDFEIDRLEGSRHEIRLRRKSPSSSTDYPDDGLFIAMTAGANGTTSYVNSYEGGTAGTSQTFSTTTSSWDRNDTSPGNLNYPRRRIEINGNDSSSIVTFWGAESNGDWVQLQPTSGVGSVFGLLKGSGWYLLEFSDVNDDSGELKISNLIIEQLND